MDTVVSCPAARRAAGVAARLAIPALALWALAGFTAAPVESRILFAADTAVPGPVQELAWRVIETRCNYQSHERWQRSFWAYDARARRVDGGTVYSIEILSDLTWKKTEPPAIIAMTLVDDGRLRLTALRSWFIACGN
jgi:hypothetical protein